jgi:hypothetical protein
MTPFRLGYDNHSRQRVQLEDAGSFDELVLYGRVDPKTKRRRVIAHLEVMDTHVVWMQIGDAYVSLQDDPSGVKVCIGRGEYGEARGATEYPGADGGRVSVRHVGKRKRGKS